MGHHYRGVYLMVGFKKWLDFLFPGQIRAGPVYIDHNFSLYSKCVSPKKLAAGEQVSCEKYACRLDYTFLFISCLSLTYGRWNVLWLCIFTMYDCYEHSE